MPGLRQAVLLVAHGSRRPGANDDLVQLAWALRETGEFDLVETAYLELAPPDIPAGAAACAAAGATHVRILPYFLSAGTHVAEDLERHRRELAQQFPQVEFVLCGPIGLHPLMIEIVLDRLREASGSRP